MKRVILLLISMIGLSPGLPALAQAPASQPDDVATLKKQMQELRMLLEQQRGAHQIEMDEMKQKVSDLATQVAASSQPDPDAELRQMEVAVLVRKAQEELAKMERATSALQSFNPEISLVGDFQGRHDTNKAGVLSDKRLAKELELGISGNIDPYVRFNSVLSVHPRVDEITGEDHTGYDIDVEEAYLSPLEKPYGLDWKLGKFRVDFGKINESHQHALPWPEYPLVIQKFFGEEGLEGEGASVSWLAPGDRYIELTAQSIAKSKDTLLGGDDSDSFVQVLHLKTFNDLSKESTLEWGFSGAVMPNSNTPGASNVAVEGMDVTYKWRPQKEGLYKSFKWMTEVLASQRTVDGRAVNALGLYTAPEYQFARRWAAGLRYDYTQDPDNAARVTNAGSAYLTFMQSEFCYWRVGYQLSHTNFPVNGSNIDHTIFLQLDFTLGPHPAHKY